MTNWTRELDEALERRYMAVLPKYGQVGKFCDDFADNHGVQSKGAVKIRLHQLGLRVRDFADVMRV